MDSLASREFGGLGAFAEQIGRCFDELARAHESATESGMCAATDLWVARQLSELAAALPAGDGLFLGCGTGREATALVEAGWTAILVDASSAMVDLARDRFRRNPAVQVVRADVASFLETPPARFDAVIAVGEVLSYVPQPKRLLSASVAALRPAGWVLLTYMNARVIRGRLVSEDAVQRTADGIRFVEREGLQAGDLTSQAFDEGVVDGWATAAGLVRAKCSPQGQARIGRLYGSSRSIPLKGSDTAGHV